jgi:hypothetical protein
VQVREVLIRFESSDGEGSVPDRVVSGSVEALENSDLRFRFEGWLQLLGVLETLTATSSLWAARPIDEEEK